MDSSEKIKYTEQKQAILKTENGNFKIMTQYGKEIEVEQEYILVYLFCNGQSEIKEIQKLIKENYKNLLISEEDIKKIIDLFISENFLKTEADKKEFHPIYSFNPFKVVKKLDIKCDKDTIISVGKLEMEMTNKCPFNCSYCMRKVISKNEAINFEQKKKLVYDCFEMGAYSLNITGGEPLHKEIVDETLELIKYAKKLGYKRLMVSTSGFGVKENLSRLVDAGVNEIQISYNQCELYEEDRVRNKFIEDNIESIAKVMEYGIRLGVCCVLTKENLGKIKDVIDFCNTYNIYSIYFYPVMPVGGAVKIWDEIKIDSKSLVEVFEQINRYKDMYADQIYLSVPQSFLLKKDEIKQTCEGGTYMIYVSTRGEVSACACCTPSDDNIKNKSIEEIWTNSIYFKKYREIKNYKEPCSKCNNIVYCINSCIMREVQAVSLGLKYECNDCKLENLIQI